MTRNDFNARVARPRTIQVDHYPRTGEPTVWEQRCPLATFRTPAAAQRYIRRMTGIIQGGESVEWELTAVQS